MGTQPYGGWGAGIYRGDVQSRKLRNLLPAIVLPAILALAEFQQACAQSKPFLFSLTFRGTSYETNAAGQVITSPATDTSLLQEIATAAGGIDPKTLAFAYHFNGSGFGDTIDVVNRANGATLDTFLGFYFGSDPTLGRIALTNASNTVVRRVDQLYTKQSIYALGSAFLTKRFVADAQGNVRATIDADLHYLILPKDNRPARMIVGTFTTTRPFQPHP